MQEFFINEVTKTLLLSNQQFNTFGTMYLKKRIPFRLNEVKNFYFNFILNLLIDSIFIIPLSLSLPHSLRQYGKKNFELLWFVQELAFILCC